MRLVDELFVTTFIPDAINGLSCPFPDPLAGRFVNPLAVNHAISVSLSNGVSDLVYIVVSATNERTSWRPNNFNACM